MEIGANWINGGSYSNPVFNLANQNPDLLALDGVPVTRFSRRPGYFFTFDGKCVDEETGLKAYDAFIEIEEEISSYFAEWKKGGEKVDLRSKFEELIPQKIREHFHRANEAKDAEDCIFGMTNYLRFHAGDDLELCDARLYGSYWDIPGGNVYVPGGYVNVFKEIYQRIHHRVLFNKEVVSLDYNRGESVDVECRDGSRFRCDHAIVTIPLGYLKKHRETLFNPPLPLNKSEAIEKMGFGRAGKVFLEFEKPFWAKGEGSVKIAWGKNNIKEAELPDEWYKWILGFDEVINNDRVLVCWIGGSATEVMERLPDAEVLETLIRVFRKCTGDVSVPAPVRILKTGWCSNPFTLGGYSYTAYGAEIPENPLALAEPVNVAGVPRLLFAGEATHETGYSALQGARWSGLREAERLLKLSQ